MTRGRRRGVPHSINAVECPRRSAPDVRGAAGLALIGGIAAYREATAQSRGTPAFPASPPRQPVHPKSLAPHRCSASTLPVLRLPRCLGFFYLTLEPGDVVSACRGLGDILLSLGVLAQASVRKSSMRVGGCVVAIDPDRGGECGQG